MLVLTRKANESILIGENVVVTVSRISGGRVRLSIDAPREVTILRSEIPRHRLAVDAPSLEMAIPAVVPVTQAGLAQAG